MKTLRIMVIAVLCIAVPVIIFSQQRQSAKQILQNKNTRSEIMTTICNNPQMAAEMIGYMMQNKQAMQMMMNNRGMMQSMMNTADRDTSASRSMIGAMMQHPAMMQMMMQMMSMHPDMMKQMHHQGMMH